MRPKKYPYSGKLKQERLSGVKTPALVIFPNISFRKELLKHIYTVTKNHGNSTIIYFNHLLQNPKSFWSIRGAKS